MQILLTFKLLFVNEPFTALNFVPHHADNPDLHSSLNMGIKIYLIHIEPNIEMNFPVERTFPDCGKFGDGAPKSLSKAGLVGSPAGSGVNKQPLAIRPLQGLSQMQEAILPKVTPFQGWSSSDQQRRGC